MTALRGRLQQRQDHLVVGNRRVAVVDEPAGGGLQANGTRRDHEVAQRHLRLERAARADPDEASGRSVIARISATTISTLSVPIPVDTTETRWPR